MAIFINMFINKTRSTEELKIKCLLNILTLWFFFVYRDADTECRGGSGNWDEDETRRVLKLNKFAKVKKIVVLITVSRPLHSLILFPLPPNFLAIKSLIARIGNCFYERTVGHWLLLHLVASKEAVFGGSLHVHCMFPEKWLFVNFTWTLSTGREAVLWPCSSRKAGDLPRNNFRLTGVLTLLPPPVTVTHFFREEPSPAVISSSSLARYGVPRRSDSIEGKMDRSTSCLIVMDSLYARGVFKPFSKRRASLSLDSSARSGSTARVSKAAMSSSGKCSDGSQEFSAGE